MAENMWCQRTASCHFYSLPFVMATSARPCTSGVHEQERNGLWLWGTFVPLCWRSAEISVASGAVSRMFPPEIDLATFCCRSHLHQSRCFFCCGRALDRTAGASNCAAGETGVQQDRRSQFVYHRDFCCGAFPGWVCEVSQRHCRDAMAQHADLYMSSTPARDEGRRSSCTHLSDHSSEHRQDSVRELVITGTVS